MKTLSLLAASLLPLSATPENPLIPATWFQEITAADGSTQQSIIFTTVPGVEYTFYHSDELENWTEIGKSYGLGQQFSAAMRETAPPPPPPYPQNPPPPAPSVFPASITMQSSSDPAGGTVVSWPSLDHGNAVQHLIAGNMVAAWDTVPLFAETYGTHQFFIFHPTGTTPPPAENGILGTKDSEMIADLEAAWSGFNTAVTTARETARNTPPPPPPAPDSRGFWRIKADWSLDSDNDGIQDHAEFAFAAANPPGADGLAGNPFNADTNGDGRPDGEEIDTDKDGIFDFEDIDKNDKLVAFKKVKLPRYAMFEFDDNLQVTDSDGWGWSANAIAINNRGTVLFNDRVWKAGEFHLLNRRMTDIPQQEQNIYYQFSDAFAINDSDQIIGSASNTFEGTGNGAEYGFTALCYWMTPAADPQRVWKDDAGVQINAELPTHYDLPQSIRGKTQLDNNGRFFTKSFSWDINKPPRHEQELGWKEWTIPQVEGGALTSAAATQYSKGRAERDVIWTSEYDSLADLWIGGDIISPFTSPIPVKEPSNVVWQGDSDLLTVTSAKAGIPTQVRDKNGIWGWSNLLTDVRDIAADGTAIGRRRSFDNAAGRLLLNGNWTALDRVAPGLPLRWTASNHVHLADTSSEGWILAHDRDISDFDPDDVSAALLPLRFTGIYTNPDSNETFEEATGVDDFSISSSDPDLSQDPSILEPIREKIWIMAPQEGTKTIKIDVPLHETSKLKISGNALKFNGQNQVVLDGTDQTFTVSAESSIASGNEVEAILEISDGTWDTPSVTRPLAFKVMKKRTVKVIVYKIGEKSPPRPFAST